MEKREIYDNFCNQLVDIRHNINGFLKNLLIEQGGEVVVSDEIDDYIYPAIAYNGGRHPEYASDCYGRVEVITYDAEHDEVIITFEEDCTQELSENSVDDVLVVIDIILKMIEHNLI